MNDMLKDSKLLPGRYIVAVSGGVDSMVLLDALRRHRGIEIVVAHVDHGMRKDSYKDTLLVASVCKSHNITVASTQLHLGAESSEACARAARYSFLRKCLSKYKAIAIVTAHHEDDVIETAVMNIMRGTGWRGIAPFVDGKDILRPLESTAKTAILAHAIEQRLTWRDDTTNSDQRYTRNYIRHTVIPSLITAQPHWRDTFLRLIRSQQQLRRTIENELRHNLTLHTTSTGDRVRSQRYMWCMLPEREGYEVMQALCRHILGHSLLRERAEAALLFAKVGRAHKVMLLSNLWQLRVTVRELIVEPR